MIGSHVLAVTLGNRREAAADMRGQSSSYAHFHVASEIATPPTDDYAIFLQSAGVVVARTDLGEAARGGNALPFALSPQQVTTPTAFSPQLCPEPTLT